MPPATVSCWFVVAWSQVFRAYSECNKGNILDAASSCDASSIPDVHSHALLQANIQQDSVVLVEDDYFDYEYYDGTDRRESLFDYENYDGVDYYDHRDSLLQQKQDRTSAVEPDCSNAMGLKTTDPEFVLLADGNLGHNGCHKKHSEGVAGYTPGKVASKKECQERCVEHGCRYMQFHNSNYCGLYMTCELTRWSSDYISKARVFGHHTAHNSFTLIADGNLGQSGCSRDQNSARVAGYKAKKAASQKECEDRCVEYGCQHMQFHNGGWCGLFTTCSLSRPASDYLSKALVFKREF